MGILLNAINDNVEAIEDELRFYVCDKLNNDSLDVYVGFSIQEGFSCGWSNVTVFKIWITICKNEDEILSDWTEICEFDQFESEVDKLLSGLEE